MIPERVTAASPMRILETSIRGGLGAGNLGVLLARAGVGKTALLVRIGLDDALRDRAVLHVALGQNLEQTIGWYNLLFEDLERRSQLENPLAVREMVSRRRTIQAFPDAKLSAERLRGVIKLYAEHVAFEPTAILIDDYPWGDDGGELRGIKAVAAEIGAELWMTARTHREGTQAQAKEIPPPCATHAESIDVALCLEPQGTLVRIGLLKDHENDTPTDTPLLFDPDTMRLVRPNGETSPLRSQEVTLLSGGAAGAEAAFGAAAEQWGVQEKNFSFAGREPERQVSIIELGEDALNLGGVSSRYVESHLNRSFPDTPEFKMLLQSIWHQVVTAGQVFVVGAILEDDTVRGGTGWAAELAKHLQKHLFVFDQERGGWWRWHAEDWHEVEMPRIETLRFCGTGTRHLSPTGKEAIEALFERSFGTEQKGD